MNFSIKEAFAFGWRSTRNYFLQVLLVLGISLVINALLRFLFDSLVEGDFIWKVSLHAFVILVVIALDVLVQIGVTKEVLLVVKGKKPNIKNLLSYWDFFFKVLFAWITYGLFLCLVFVLALFPFFVVGAVTNLSFLFIVGLMVSFIACVYAIITFGFARLIVVDHGSGPLQSLRLSEEITRGHRAQILLFFVLSCLLNLGGLLVFFLGLIVTIPVSFFALIWVYDRLLHKRLTAGQK